MEKTCPACQQLKPLDEFYTDNSRPDGKGFYCKPCTKAKVKDYSHRAPREETPEGMRRCQYCHEVKPNGEFYANKKIADDLSKRCKVCARAQVTEWRGQNKEKHRESSRKWAAANPALKRDVQLKTTYGLAYGAYDTMLVAQEGRCAICQTSTPKGKTGRFHVDHDHGTGQVRGLLCSPCNTGIGQLQHDPDLILRAIDYLRRYRLAEG